MLRIFVHNCNNLFTLFIIINYVFHCLAQNLHSMVITPKLYSDMLVRRREEQKLFVKHLLKADYEKNYKMLNLAYFKIFEIITENNATLHQSDYNPKNGFPTDKKLQDAVTLILENTCLVGEIVLHLPEISYRILKKHQDWSRFLNWCIKFVDDFSQILNEETSKMLELFGQEINHSSRTQEFINPYYDKKRVTTDKRIKARKKRLRRGPQLRGKFEL